MAYADVRPTGWPTLVRALVVMTGLVLMISQSQYLEDEPAVDLARWVLLALLGGLLAVRPPKRVLVRRPHAVDGFFLAFVTLAFASAIYTSSISMTLQRATSLVLLYVAVFWTLWYYADLVGEEKLVDTLILTAAAVFVLGALSYFATETSLMRGRFRGVMENPNAVGMLTIIFLPLVISRLIRKRRILDLALIGLIVVSVALSGSRNGVLTASLSIMFLLWRIRAWKATLLMAVVGFTLLLAMPDSGVLQELESRPELTRIISGQPGKPITSGRAEAWQVAIPIVQSRLMLGHGFGTEDRIFEGISFRVHRGLYVHNSYLGLAYQIGVIGSALMFGPLLFLLFARAFARRTESVQTASFEAVLFGGLVAAFFESWVYSVGNAFAFPFWICIMLLIRSGVRAPATAPMPLAVNARAAIRRTPYLPQQELIPAGGGGAVRRFDPPTPRYR